jgi:hypothetical protein
LLFAQQIQVENLENLVETACGNHLIRRKPVLAFPTSTRARQGDYGSASWVIPPREPSPGGGLGAYRVLRLRDTSPKAALAIGESGDPALLFWTLAYLCLLLLDFQDDFANFRLWIFLSVVSARDGL